MAGRTIVCHLITLLELGGAQRNTLYTVGHLDRSRFIPHLVAGPGGILDEEAAGLPAVSFSVCPYLRRPLSPYHDTRALLWLTGYLRAIRPHVVHTHSSKAGILGRLAAHLAGVPVVIHTVHGWGFHPFQPRVKRMVFQVLERAVAPLTTHFVAVSRANVDQGMTLGIMGPGRATVIRSGVELARFRHAAGSGRLRAELGLAPDTPLVGMVACLKPQKAPLDYVAVAHQVVREVPDAHFVLVGDGDLRPRVEEAVQRHALAGRFHLLGWRDEPEVVIGDLDILLLTSLHEGLPRVVPEAMAAGRPVVATAVDGTPEAVREELTGRLAPPRDIAGLARAAVEILRDPRLARRLGEAGCHLAEEWDIDAMVRRQEDLYLELLADGA